MGDDAPVQDEDITLYQVLFDMNHNLCENFPGLSPFAVRRENFHEVVTMFVRLIDHRQRTKTNSDENGNDRGKKQPEHKYSGGYLHGNKTTRLPNGMIRRPARDDSWY